FFSSRRRHTRFSRDWSSDVCSSDLMKDAMDAAISKLIVGQTASSQGTPGRLGNDDLQGEVRNDLVKADADLVSASFRRQALTWLCEWNFPGAGVPSVWRETEDRKSTRLNS